MKPDGGSARTNLPFWTLITMKQFGGRFDAGPAGASMPLPSKLSIFFSSASTLARVGLGPAAVRAWTKRRADSQPKAAKMSGLPPTDFSHLLKSWTSGMLSSPWNIASCWSRIEPLVADAAADLGKVGSEALAPQLADGPLKPCCFLAFAPRTKAPT